MYLNCYTIYALYCFGRPFSWLRIGEKSDHHSSAPEEALPRHSQRGVQREGDADRGHAQLVRGKGKRMVSMFRSFLGAGFDQNGLAACIVAVM